MVRFCDQRQTVSIPDGIDLINNFFAVLYLKRVFEVICNRCILNSAEMVRIFAKSNVHSLTEVTMKKNIIIASVSVAGTLVIVALVMVILHCHYSMRGHRFGEFQRAPYEQGMFFSGRELKGKLKLTDEQEAKIDAINDTYRKEARSAKDKIRPTLENLEDAMRSDKIDVEKVRTLMKAQSDFQAERAVQMIKRRTEIESVLTADQLAKIRKHNRGRMFPGMMGRGNMGPGMMRSW
jgi:Spy/CpxP family protein refolding chaperone